MSSLRCPRPAYACLDFPSPVSRPRLCRKTNGSAAVAKFSPCPSGLPVLPLRYVLAAFRPDVHTWPSRSVPSVPPCQRTHTWTNPRSFAFPLVEGSTSSLVTIDHAGSRPACAAGLKPQPLSVRLQDGLGFLQRSSARHSLNAPCGIACLYEAECRVYHVPLEQ